MTNLKKNCYQQTCDELRSQPKNWLITGVAGFIGSNLLERLLTLDQRVVGLDNFATGHRLNLERVEHIVGAEKWRNFQLVEGSIEDFSTCLGAMTINSKPDSQGRGSGDEKVAYVLHQAALGSVPRSLGNPLATNHTNVTGFLNVLLAAKESGVESFTYAASSSTYGDHPGLPKKESIIGRPLSPYAVTKYVNELYAEVFAKNYGFRSIGLRYFNVFGPRQDPMGSYAAVIPAWTAAMIEGRDIYINGNGATSRDFCFIENVVQANILSAVAGDSAKDQVYNVALGDKTSLNELFSSLKSSLEQCGIRYEKEPIYREFRTGDVMHSQAEIEKAKKMLGYEPSVHVLTGLKITTSWFVREYVAAR